MKRLFFGFACAIGFFGCAANTASLSHFPSTADLDFEKIDTLQGASDRPHRFFYNCNFVNDFLIKAELKDKKEIKNRIAAEVEKSGYGLIRSSDSLVIADRGITPWEWNTLAAVYVGNIGQITYVYIRTEISQDFTCGPDINRAKPIVERICNEALKCLEIKELTDKTKSRVWPLPVSDGGLENERFTDPESGYPPE